MTSVIKVQNLSKRYRLGLREKKAETLSGQVINLIKSPWQNLKRLREMSRFGIEDDSVFWALKDINFEVKEGEVLGVIGKNGAGKSTLLKILSQITEPTSGRIEIKGRVASLLEVGTGFHPELSGRENIYMNGTILGMTRREIDSKLDEIIDFSGVEKFIDTAVKFYSSGMKVRLGFSVAAHLEPEILIIDEVLAVGDYEFQKKCLGKMDDISKNQGRTVLFVSHNLASVKSLCSKAIVLDKGLIDFYGDTENSVNFYLSKFFKKDNFTIEERKDRVGNGIIKFHNIRFFNSFDEEIDKVISGEFIKIRINFSADLKVVDVKKLFLGIGIFDQEGYRVASFLSDEMGIDFSKIRNKNFIDLVVPNFNVRGGLYSLTLHLGLGSTSSEDFLDFIENAKELNVLQGDFWKSGKLNRKGSYSLINGVFK